jgi:hypothetical protein
MTPVMGGIKVKRNKRVKGPEGKPGLLPFLLFFYSF